MKKMLLFIIAVTFSYSSYGQEFKALDKSPLDMIEYPAQRGVDKVMRVLYSRPQLKGREFNKIVSNGKLWRTGANESTEITFFKSMNFGGKKISPGSYTLYTIPGAKEWTIIINSATHTWGSYNYKESDDIMRIIVPVSKSKKSLEALSMAFEALDNGANLHIGWDDIRVAVPFKN